jgi:hypothetical protein
MNKVFAVAATIGMIGATMVGALADLGNYPAPFVEDGAFNGAIVVGANAATSDVLGAIDIAASLQAEAVTGTPIAGGTVSVVGGATLDTYDLNQEISESLTQSDVESLLDTQVRWDSNDYDVYEQIDLADLYVATYYPGGTLGDDTFGSDPYMIVNAPDGIVYSYNFDETIGDGTTDLTDKALEIKFLGKTLKISDTNAADNSITVESSSEYYLEQGDSVDVDGHTVTLKKVGTNSVLVTVDGQTLAIGDGNSETFDQSNDFEVEVTSMFYIDGATDNSATLKMGNSLIDTVSDGDPMEMFGEPSDADNAEWFWSIDVTADHILTAGDHIGAAQAMERTLPTVTGADERPALAMGEKLNFPNDYASIEFVGYDSAKETTYDELEVRPVSVKVAGTYNQSMEISSDVEKDAFYVYDGATLLDKTGKLYVVEGADNDHVDIYNADKELVFNELDTTNSSQYVAFMPDKEATKILMADGAWTVTADNGDEFTLDVDNTALDGFGATLKSADDTDVLLGATKIGDNDETFRTTYGIIVKDMQNQMDGDDFVISVPEEQQVPIVVVAGKGSSTSVSDSGMSYTVNPIALGLGVLDTDATLGSKPMIVVGGPVINTVAAELMGNPTPDQIAATFTQGKAIIKWYNAKQAMLVAGYEAMETQGAAYVVARHSNYDFTGNELEVVVTSLNDITVNTV